MRWPLVVLLALCGCLTRPLSAQRVDPAVLSLPAEPPTLQEAIKGEAWDALVPQIDAKFTEAEALMKKGAPAFGEKIDDVTPQEPGAKAGLEKGQIIVAVDGQPAGQLAFEQLREAKDQQLSLYLPSGETKTITVPPGMLGIQITKLDRPELSYLRGKRRDAKWDKFIVAGYAYRASKPDLAETALAKAIKAGYAADALFYRCAAEIDWRQGKNDAALAYIARAQAGHDESQSPAIDSLAYQLAVANFKISQALSKRMSNELVPPSVKPEIAARLAALRQQHDALPEAQRTAPSPMELSAQNQDGLFLHMHPRVKRDRIPKNNWRDEVQGGYYEVHTYVPNEDDPDVHFVMHMKIKGHDRKKTIYLREFTMSLVNCDNPDFIADDQPISPHMLRFTLDTDGWCSVGQGSGDNYVTLQTLYVADAIAHYRQFNVHLLHAGGRDEVWIDNRRLLYLPASESPRKIGFAITNVGCTFDASLEFSKIQATK